MIKAFIFDMGGTLEDVAHKPEFNKACGEVVLKYLASQGIYIEMEPDAFTLHVEQKNREYRHWGMVESLRELDPYSIWSQWYLKDFEVNQERLRTIADKVANLWERNYYQRALRPESRELLQTLKDRGFRLGVISNTGCQTQVIEILHEYGLHHYFDTIYLSSIAGVRKPHADLFLAAAADLGCTPPECVYVGDTVSRDVRGARAAGYGASVRIQSHLTQISDARYETQEEEADYPVSNLLDILKLDIAKPVLSAAQ
ncbi:MAG: HAD family hydrolase [Oscillospiraceae bacterium]|jgi:putative hydrolase of the HAD superfamily